MANSKDPKQPPQWPVDPGTVAPPTPVQRPATRLTDEDPDDDLEMQKTGRIVHDERGNAVWDWMKSKGRAAIDSTSTLLKRLDLKSFKLEGDPEEGPGKPNARDAGGGYDPYNQRTPVKKVPPTTGAKPPATPPKRK